MKIFSRVLLLAPLFLFVFLSVAPASASAADSVDVGDLKKLLIKQDSIIKKQQRVLSEQSKKLASQQKEINENKNKLDEIIKNMGVNIKVADASDKDQTAVNAQAKASDEEMSNIVGAGKKSSKSKEEETASSSSSTASKAANPVVTVKAPQDRPMAVTSITAPAKKEEARPEIAVLPDSGGVLTPKGTLTYENSLEYVNTTNNLYTFNGVQVAEVVFIGVTSATTAKRQIVQDSNRFRLGLTNNLEADVRIPYVYRNDTTTETSGGTTTRRRLEGNGLGDVDGGLAYQINKGQDEWPFFVANLRYKANNADGPFDVSYDSNNVATKLPTGTGFNSVEGSLTAIKVTDPAVLFGNLGYVANLNRTFNKDFGDTRVLEVEPGDAINFSAGMGFSINPETSFTLGYKHSYVFETTQHNKKISTGALIDSESDSSSIGALMTGVSYRINPIVSINMNAEVGATREAPDVRVGLRVPVRLGTVY